MTVTGKGALLALCLMLAALAGQEAAAGWRAMHLRLFGVSDRARGLLGQLAGGTSDGRLGAELPVEWRKLSLPPLPPPGPLALLAPLPPAPAPPWLPKPPFPLRPPEGPRQLPPGRTFPYFGEAGEAWDPQGPFMDFSYAGYRNNEDAIPTPPITRTLGDFLGGANASSTDALEAMVAWANAQPASAGWVVLSVPEGSFTLERPLTIKRSRTVLRGAGRYRTRLFMPYSLTQVLGPSPLTHQGYYVYSGAFLTAEGWFSRKPIANVTAAAPRGSRTLHVENTTGLRAGQVVTLWCHGGDGELSLQLLNHRLPPSDRMKDRSLRFSSRIAAVGPGNVLTLERALPITVTLRMRPGLVRQQARVFDVGFEGFTMEMKWEPYNGHHLELGWSGIELNRVADSWVRDVAFVNVDNAVLVAGCDRVSVQDFEVGVSKERRGGPELLEGHWGARIGTSVDVRVSDFSILPNMRHGVGADTLGQFSVFERGRIIDSNLEVHRALVAQVLFTDIDLVNSTEPFYSGGPPISGPNTCAWSVFWNLTGHRGPFLPPRHNTGKDFGLCTWGPDLTFAGVTFDLTGHGLEKLLSKRPEGPVKLCDNWWYQPGDIHPPNLFRAQLDRRRRLRAQAVPAAGGGATQSGDGAVGPAAGGREAAAPKAGAHEAESGGGMAVE